MEQRIMSGESLLERQLQAQQDAVMSLDKLASEHITAYYTPSRHEQMMRMSQTAGPVAPSRVVLLVQDDGQSFSVKHGQDVLGASQLTIDDVAKLTGGADGVGKLQVHGVGHYPNAIRAVQHLKGISPSANAWDLMQAVKADPSVVNKPKNEVLEIVHQVASSKMADPHAATPDAPSVTRSRHH